MNYDFPVFSHIDEVLPAIEGSPEFSVSVRDGYTVINYKVEAEDSFPPVKVAGGSAKMRAERSRNNAIRRECRGLVFCNDTGKILRKPYHKFFNVNQREETLDTKIDLAADHVLLDKADGSMIAPFLLNGAVIWGTKNVAMDFHETVAGQFGRYELMVRELIGLGFTPIYEYVAPTNRIVLTYDRPQLILTAVRNMTTGAYVDYEQLVNYGAYFDCPVVKKFDSIADVAKLLAHTRDLTEVEGYVVRWADGHMAKVKCDWYVQIHRAKEKILFDRHIVDMIVNSTIDDVLALLPEDDVQRIEVFQGQLFERISNLSISIRDELTQFRAQGVDRKTFAIEHSKKYDGYTRAILFAFWDEECCTNAIYDRIIKTIGDNLTTNTKWEALRDVWFPGVVCNA